MGTSYSFRLLLNLLSSSSKGTRLRPGLDKRTILEVYELIKNKVFKKSYQVCISFEMNPVNLGSDSCRAMPRETYLTVENHSMDSFSSICINFNPLFSSIKLIQFDHRHKTLPQTRPRYIKFGHFSYTLLDTTQVHEPRSPSSRCEKINPEIFNQIP